MTDVPVVAGIDLGGTASRILIRQGAKVLACRAVLTSTLGEGSPEARLQRLAGVIRDLLPPGSRVQAIGIGASGPVDRARGIVCNEDTLAPFSFLPIVADLQERFGAPIVIDNDAVAAAIAEYRLGAGRGAKRMLMVTLGTGIGVALLMDGTPFRGPDGTHPEGGHLPITTTAEPCYCGLRGCWEQVASRTALQTALRPHFPEEGSDQHLLARAAERADTAEIRDVFHAYGRHVGRGLAVLHTLYAPDVTVLGGSAVDQFDLFLPGLIESGRRSAGYSVSVEIRRTALGDDAGALGAAVMALS